MKKGLLALKEVHKKRRLIGRVRGEGTFTAVTCYNAEIRDKIVYEMRQRGVVVGGCGNNSVRFRPSMLFTEEHVDEFLTIFNEVLGEIEIPDGAICMVKDGSFLYPNPI